MTTLNPDYPLIRFATGDLSALMPGQSPCGRTNMRIKGWMGRADQTTKIKGMFVRPEQVAALVAQSHDGDRKAPASLPAAKASVDVMTVQIEADGGGQAASEIRARAAEALALDLRARGWTVFSATDAEAGEMRGLARRLRPALRDGNGPDRVLIVLSGLLAETDRDAWLLQPGKTRWDNLNVGSRGLSLGALAELAAEAPGRAILIVGMPDRQPDVVQDARPFSGEIDLPQGVSLVTGPMEGLRRWTREVLLSPQMPLDRALDNLPEGAEASGFISDTASFAPLEDAGGASPMGEMAYWNAVGDIGTEAGYRAYLERYPQGIFAEEARAKLRKTVVVSPRERAEQAEAALRLNRSARRQVQRNLALLGFDPRGIDGVFGRGSRAAIAAWQRSAGYDDHGFMTAGQVAALQRQADVRAAELEREARLRREAEERADREYWRQLGRDEASLRAYLKRYPDGLFAGDARAQLDLILEERRRAVEAVQRQAWDEARAQDTIEAYDRFLREFPEGGFAGEARQRREELIEERRNADRNSQLQEAENRAVPNRGARVLVEQVLQLRGLKPGKPDGKFTRETRRAIRRFQKAQGLPVTGYVTQQTMVMLMLSNR